MATNPTLLTQPIAANGAKNVIPNTTSTAGAMSQDQGFPAETALPLGAGGVAPTREDFNGAFNLLSGILYMAQKGWQFEFDETQDYFAGCIVRDTLDGKLYEAINDVSASSTHPSTDSVNWKLGTDMSAYTTTVNSPMFNKRDILTTSGTYTAPITGWYKIIAKGGGGGGSASNGSPQPWSGSGGGEGGTTIAYVSMTAGDTATVIIGAGGTPNVAGSNDDATAGGNTSVTIDGNTYTAGGGGGAKARVSGSGFGGSGSILGCAGIGGGRENDASFSIIAGAGGGAGGGSASNGIATDGISGGGGSGGGYDTSVHDGGNGGDGYVWFEYFDSSLNP